MCFVHVLSEVHVGAIAVILLLYGSRVLFLFVITLFVDGTRGITHLEQSQLRRSYKFSSSQHNLKCVSPECRRILKLICNSMNIERYVLGGIVNGDSISEAIENKSKTRHL